MTALRLLLLCCAVLAQLGAAQLPTTGQQQVSLAESALKASFGSGPVIQLSGSLERHAGGTHESGRFEIEAAASKNSFRALLGNHTDSAQQDGFFDCSYTNAAGRQQAAPAHNCNLASGWFLPHLRAAADAALQWKCLASGALSACEIVEPAPQPKDASPLYQPKPRVLTLAFDGQTITGARFAIHPDDDENTDIPVEVRFSDYRLTNGEGVGWRGGAIVCLGSCYQIRRLYY